MYIHIILFMIYNMYYVRTCSHFQSKHGQSNSLVLQCRAHAVMKLNEVRFRSDGRWNCDRSIASPERPTSDPYPALGECAFKAAGCV